jgi:hypothetical protein
LAKAAVLRVRATPPGASRLAVGTAKRKLQIHDAVNVLATPMLNNSFHRRMAIGTSGGADN